MNSFCALLLLLGLLSLITSMEAGTGKNKGRRWQNKPTPPPTTITWTPSPTTEPPTMPWTTKPPTMPWTTTNPPTYPWEITTTSNGWKTGDKHKSGSDWEKNSKNGGRGGQKSKGWNSNNKNDGSKGPSGAWNKPPPPPPPMCPVGMTHIWFGDKHSIPGGFQICDGTNGTPDLRDRLVIGAGPHFPFGSFGGASSINLAAAQLAPHTHGAGSLVANANGNHLHHFSTSINEGGHSHGFHLEAASAGEHKHKIDLQTGSAGDHDHTFDAYLPVDYNSGDEMFGVPVDKVDKDESYVQTVSSGGAHEHSVYGYTQMGGSHTHPISGSIGGSSDGKHYHHIDADTAKSGVHDHAVSGATGSTGEGAPIHIMNPYHSLYFICCVGKQHKANYY